MLDVKGHGLSEPLSARLDEPSEQAKRPTPRRDYLGASSLGNACAWRLQHFSAANDPGRQFPGHTLRVFARGHRAEDWAAQWLQQAGRGHADGMVLAGPFLLAYPALRENTAVGNKTFRALWAKLLALSLLVYATQIALTVEILRACDVSEALPRVSRSATHVECKACQWQDRCRSLPQ